MFDDIDDDTIEKSKSMADDAIASNLAKGLMTEEQKNKYPYINDGLALYYAAVEKNKNKAAKLARDAAYAEWYSSDGIIDKVGEFLYTQIRVPESKQTHMEPGHPLFKTGFQNPEDNYESRELYRIHTKRAFNTCKGRQEKLQEKCNKAFVL